MQIKLIFTRKVVRLASFESEGFRTRKWPITFWNKVRSAKPARTWNVPVFQSGNNNNNNNNINKKLYLHFALE